MSTDGITRDLTLLSLPDEILESIVSKIEDSYYNNPTTGYPYNYYSLSRRRGERHRQRTLSALCSVCKRLGGIATHYLYRNVVLTRKPYSTADLRRPFYHQANKARYDYGREYAEAKRGIETLALFLWTIVSNANLRWLVRSLDCRFFLLDAGHPDPNINSPHPPHVAVYSDDEDDEIVSDSEDEQQGEQRMEDDREGKEKQDDVKQGTGSDENHGQGDTGQEVAISGRTERMNYPAQRQPAEAKHTGRSVVFHDSDSHDSNNDLANVNLSLREFDLIARILKAVKTAAKEQEGLIISGCHVFSELTGLELSDMSERLFGAILRLVPNLESVTLPPPPVREYTLAEDYSFQPSLAPFAPLGNGYLGTYGFLNFILYEASKRPEEGPMLPHLTSVRLSYVPDYRPPGSAKSEFRQYLEIQDYTSAPEPGYAFLLWSCNSLTRIPSVTSFQTDADVGMSFDADDKQSTWAIRQLRRCNPTHFRSATSASIGPCLAGVCDNTEALQSLIVTSSEARESVVDCDLNWYSSVTKDQMDQALRKHSKTLRVLDIADYDGLPRLLWSLACLPDLSALEHLRIGIPHLCRPRHFNSRELKDILPPKLKTLTVSDQIYFEYTHSFEICETDYEYDVTHVMTDATRALNDPEEYRKGLSAMLCRFAKICRETHEHLQSVRVQFALDMRDIQELSGSRWQALRCYAIEGPNEGEIVPEGRLLKEMFEASGVEFVEMYAGMEADYPFSLHQVQRFS